MKDGVKDQRDPASVLAPSDFASRCGHGRVWPCAACGENVTPAPVRVEQATYCIVLTGNREPIRARCSYALLLEMVSATLPGSDVVAWFDERYGSYARASS